MNTKKNIPQNDISSFAKAELANATLKDDNTIFALSGNIETQITNNIELDEEFKKRYGAYGALKSQRTVVIANAEKILENMRKQAAKDEIIRDFENYGREQI